MFAASPVIIECANCNTRYQYDEARFEQKASKKIKCAKCSAVFEIHNPAATGGVESPAQPASTDREPRAGETTKTRTSKPKPKEPAPAEVPVKHDTGPRGAALGLPEGMRLSLAIIDGQNSGSVFRISKPRVTIGRSGADFEIDDSESSREHAAVEIRNTIYLIHDLQSRNGTIVNGKKITEPTELQDKSEFLIGTTTLMLIVTQES